MASEAFDALSRGWKTTCRVVFGEEIGELQEFEPYLKEAVAGKEVKSCFSGKRLFVTSRHYAQDSRFFDFGSEGSHVAGIRAKLNIDQVKDIDSLLEGIRETFIYSGNKVLGNSKINEHSDSIMDSSFTYESWVAIGSKYLAYSGPMQHTEYAFGSTSSGQSANIIRCFYNNSLKRCFEVCATVKASDSYFSYNIWRCTDCMFSFNLRNKSHMIANVQLNKEQYEGLKRKLMGELVDGLKRNRRLDYSVMDMVNGQSGTPGTGHPTRNGGDVK